MKLGKNTIASLILTFILLLASVGELSAQYYKRSSYRFTDGLSVSVMFGPTIFAGDLGLSIIDKDKRQTQLGYVGISAGLGLEKAIKEYLSIGFQANYGQLSGFRKDEDASYPNIGFDSEIYEMSLSGIVDLSNLIAGYYSFRKVNFYALVAPSIVLSNGTNLQKLDPTINNKVLEEYDASRMGPYKTFHAQGTGHIDQAYMLKAGGGAKIRIDDKWSLKIEYTGNFGIGSTPGDAWEWKVDHLDHYAFRSDGKTKTNSDFYYIGQVGLSYKIGPTNFRSNPKYNRKSYSHRYKKFRYKGKTRRRR